MAAEIITSSSIFLNPNTPKITREEQAAIDQRVFQMMESLRILRQFPTVNKMTPQDLEACVIPWGK